ncbi:Fe2+-dependent dioxygenase [Ramlibacter sp. AW1]|uniref:Fe2+-dependent dioxygenase n=1 Tax=Ramlibacter aurantiacus TaxID=2801330 RepID=A0A936ZLH7_9BURK|nr:Fe2+-dependent dioxygenase [Ramlibacter aurantiacus]MBL0419440.1 Fe2+-dependent dioxygenase [Ramlibacter aurantiacus]
MLLQLPGLLTPDEVRTARERLLASDAPWIDGRRSAGDQAVARKNNRQLAQDSDCCRRLQALVLGALNRSPQFLSAALPSRIFNPLFNRYSGQNNAYGAHIDNAMVHSRNPAQWVRTDLSCTLFLSEPQAYEGGELAIHEPGAERRIKLAAGDLLLYPGDTRHEVTPVTRGERLASFFWVQSLVRSTEQRRILWDFDQSLMSLRAQGDTDATESLTGTYHRLLRLWGEP